MLHLRLRNFPLRAEWLIPTFALALPLYGCSQVSQHVYPTVALLHVGKTAGSTVMQELQKFCCEPRCHLTWYHWLPFPASAFKADKVIITIRDPVERVVSAFNFGNPYLYPQLSDTSPSRRGCHALYSCFLDANLFANTLLDSSRCGSVAREALLAAQCEHIGRGYTFYFAASKYLLRAGSYHVIHVHNILHDLKCVFSNLTGPLPSINRRSYKHLPTPVNETGISMLKSLLQEEYDYFHLLERNSVSCSDPPFL